MNLTLLKESCVVDRKEASRTDWEEMCLVKELREDEDDEESAKWPHGVPFMAQQK